ncbi:MAG: YgiT-type zinc finger protein [Anaerolineales bacterium]|nr:YgiT-type zinc finger protein [Anaerolineales bacterium]
MVITYPKETFVPEKVTYTIDVDGKLLVIEHVPARVCLETGEQLFSAETVERIQQLILNKQKPARVMEAPVFEFA